jgi:hypothetical protein
MSISFVTAKSKALLARSSRAEAYVEVYDKMTRHIASFNCLLDTGSDYTLLPDALLPLLGIVPTSTITFSTVSGSKTTLPFIPMVNLKVEGYSISRGVAFYSSGFIPILGRNEAISAFNFGFDENYWYYD